VIEIFLLALAVVHQGVSSNCDYFRWEAFVTTLLLLADTALGEDKQPYIRKVYSFIEARDTTNPMLIPTKVGIVKARLIFRWLLHKKQNY